MMGCSKFVEFDEVLSLAKNSNILFRELYLLLAGDFAQLPTVKQEPLHDALVQSKQHYSAPKQYVMKVATLLARFLSSN